MQFYDMSSRWDIKQPKLQYQPIISPGENYITLLHYIILKLYYILYIKVILILYYIRAILLYHIISPGDCQRT